MDAEELDEKDEDERDHAVPVKNDSYVKLKRNMVKKHNTMGNLLLENSKLCKEFSRKQVGLREKMCIFFLVFLPPNPSQYDASFVICFRFPLVPLSNQSSRRYSSMLEQRKNLPAWQEKEHILDALDQCQVLVISGMTG